jgi:peptidoglycan/LPS O-acetylase OafA/YrhL
MNQMPGSRVAAPSGFAHNPVAAAAGAHTGHPPYRPDIDGLRAVAVISVVLFHAFPDSLRGGFVGVDIFFVISGYLIHALMLRELEQQTFSFRNFYARRVKRLFPALLIMAVATYAFGWFNLLDDEFKALGKHLAGGALSVANLVLWQEAGYFDASADLKPLLHLWSLGVEEQFYLLWPVALWLAWRRRMRIALLVAGAGLASFLVNVLTVRFYPVADFYSPLTRAWELMMGGMLAIRHHTAPPPATQSASSDRKAAAGFMLLALSICALDKDAAFPGWWALLPTLGACLLIDSGPDAWLNRHLLSRRGMVSIGLISYPLYLYHWPLLCYARIMAGDTPPWTLRAALVLAGLPLAWLTYRCFERPLRRRAGTTTKVAVLVALMALVAFAGFNTYQRDGLAFRMSHIVTRFTGGLHFDLDRAWRKHACFLEGNTDDARPFAPECVEAGSAPLLLLWGDSHAAALYPGLARLHDAQRIRLAQFTASGCPPLLDAQAVSPRCAAIHARAASQLANAHPDTVVLTANWQTAQLSGLAATVDAVRRAGARDIVLIGPVPHWQDSLPKVYWRYWRAQHAPLPERTTFGLASGTHDIDQRARAASTELGIRYLSAYDAFCDARGCLTRTEDGTPGPQSAAGQIVTFDDAHLTPAGADVLAAAVARYVPLH